MARPADIAAPSGAADWRARVDEHVALVDAQLRARLDAVAGEWPDLAPGPLSPPTLLAEFVASGGKRVRPALAYLGWMAGGRSGSGRAGGYDDVVRVGVALELLHAFALIHDDVMDGSVVRRGRATVHERAAAEHRANAAHGDPDRFGESVAVLVGDLAQAECDRVVASLPAPLVRHWRAMVYELVAGQFGDLVGAADARRDVDYARGVARAKTGGYTVAWPVLLGAAAARADAATCAALGEFGRAAGEAFALRDDLLGAWSEQSATGKPSGDDLRAGKPTVLLAVADEALRGADRRVLSLVGTERLNQDDVQRLREILLARGVVDTVEAMITRCVDDAVLALRGLDPNAVDLLTAAVHELAWRGR